MNDYYSGTLDEISLDKLGIRQIFNKYKYYIDWYEAIRDSKGNYSISPFPNLIYGLWPYIDGYILEIIKKEYIKVLYNVKK